jgi:hypothetical protein
MLAINRLLVGLFAIAAHGQTLEKVFYFSHLGTPQALVEATSALSSISGIRDLSVDGAKRSITMKGTADQIALAGWLIAELDQSGSGSGRKDFPLNDPTAPLAQVVYLSYVDNPRHLQDIVNAVRAVTDIQRFFPLGQQKAIVMRGLPEQVQAADWLLGVLDQPDGAQPVSTAPQQYRLAEQSWNRTGGPVIEVAALTHLDTPQAIQEVTNLTRSITDIQRAFPVFSGRYLVMRAHEDQIALANWLLKELDSTAGQSKNEFQIAGPGNQLAQVIYVNAATPQSLQDMAGAIRAETKMPRVFPFSVRNAVAMRGTSAQLAQAEQTIRSRSAQ